MPVRVEVSLSGLFCFWFGIASHSPVKFFVVPVGILSTIYVLFYRVEVDESEIRVRYWPLINRSIPMSDVQYFSGDRTIVLITATSKVSLWGLSADKRRQLFRILPERIEVQSGPRPHSDKAPSQSLRTHVRVTKFLGAGFLAISLTLIPFLHGRSLSYYWDPWGKIILLTDMALFLLLLFEIGITLVYWLYLQDK
jgi:hypothetical protein